MKTWKGIRNMQELFEAAKVALSLAFLFYASWSDYKIREVTNRVWILYAPTAFALSTAELLLYTPEKTALFGLSVGVTVAIAFALFYSGGFGGADSKALMCLAFALPFFPSALLTPIIASAASLLAQNLFPLTVFSNAVLFAAASGLYLLLYNIAWHRNAGKKLFDGTLAAESVGKKLIVLITGYKVSIAKLKAKWHIYPLEDVADEVGGSDETLQRKLIVVPRDEGRDDIVTRLSKAADAGKIDAKVWATPGLPMLIFLTLGLAVALVFGDIVWLIVSCALG
ncbi:MAG: prepilin peptidase [Candidatus Bathyarchaeota archaeon]|nr:prepilin peptidase [Candidatus Bathyarchaeota archaeon]